MCGIAGILNFSETSVDPELLKRMIRMIWYRGPDDSGMYKDGPVGLAHARLSIIDLAGGRQPMCNEDKSLWITFNGEIFNYVELREELIRKGHRFATQSDTEVILHLYEEKGEDCVKYFNGQWAFAIWDAKNHQLFLSRDRLGVRPLFYTVKGHQFIFGSEIKSIFAHPNVEKEIDLHALDQIFTFWFTLPPRTIFKNILELPPGHSLIVKDRKISVRPYWRLDYTQGLDHATEMPKTEQQYADGLLDLLIDATRLRLRSDVPVGAYLSGGLDSSVITALIKQFTSTPLKTFSVTFDDKEFDESPYQNEMIEYLHTEHQSLRCSNHDIGQVFPEVIWHTEKPVLRTAPAPLYLLSTLVHDHGYKVVLTGEGSDEILGGYDIFKEAKIRRFWGVYPDSRFRPLLLRRLYPYLRNLQSQSTDYLKAFFHVRTEDFTSPFFSHIPRWDLTSKLKNFFSDEVKSRLKSYDSYVEMSEVLPENYSKWDFFSQSQYLETRFLLPGYILSSQGDRVAMAHSIEGRFPFLDHRVVEFAAGIPPHLKMKGLNEKYILKRCAQDLIPSSIRKRHKQPYRAPEGKSFFQENWKTARYGYVDELLSFRTIQEGGLFNPVAVHKLLEKTKNGHAIGMKDNMALVGVMATQLIVDQFINNFGKRSIHGTA